MIYLLQWVIECPHCVFILLTSTEISETITRDNRLMCAITHTVTLRDEHLVNSESILPQSW